MPDMEKVIKGMECIISSGNAGMRDDCANCVYPGGGDCFAPALRDALALLKAQEPVKPKIVDTSNSKLYHNDMFKNHYCGNCGEFLHVVNRKDLFCSQCGRAVKWE